MVIDTASGLDENTLAALEYATDLLLISATDVPSIRATVKEIEALRVIGKPQHLWHFVLNRADARTGLTIPAIERTVGINVDVAIPSSRVGAAVAQPGRAARAVRPAVGGVAGDAPARPPPRAAGRRPTDTAPDGHLPEAVTTMKPQRTHEAEPGETRPTRPPSGPSPRARDDRRRGECSRATADPVARSSGAPRRR